MKLKEEKKRKEQKLGFSGLDNIDGGKLITDKEEIAKKLKEISLENELDRIDKDLAERKDLTDNDIKKKS